jgi:DNA polymerase III epsilon subunit-like protein
LEPRFLVPGDAYPRSVAQRQVQDGARVPCTIEPEYLVFDLETTGLGDRCRIVEIACIVLGPGLETRACYETLVNPEGAPGPTWLHGLSRRTLQLAPMFEDVAGDIERLFRDRVPVAHNFRFDWGVLRRSFAPFGVEAPATPGGICTAAVARRVLGGSSALGRVCGRLGIDYPAPHRAEADAAAAVQVLKVLRALAPERTSGRPCPTFAGAWRLRGPLPAMPRAKAESSLTTANFG